MEAHKLLEKTFGDWVGVPNVVACSSGTAALHLALEVLRAELTNEHKKDAEVILPDYTMVACARAVVLAGFKPVFADVEPSSLTLSAKTVQDRITDKTVAVMAVHTYGRKPNMNDLAMLCDRNDLWLIEDLAEAHTTKPHWRTNAACWSFYKNKIVRGEEGGAVSFQSDYVAPAMARKLRSLGFTDAHDYTHIPRGHNYRLANALAELVLVHLRQIESNADVFNPNCQDWKPVDWMTAREVIDAEWNRECPAQYRTEKPEALWVHVVRAMGMNREQQTEIVNRIQGAGIPARFGFKPMTWQSEFSKRYAITNPNSEKAASEVFYLPIDPTSFNPAWPRVAFEIVDKVLGRSTRQPK